MPIARLFTSLTAFRSPFQVQPDMDELTENAEDIAEEGEKKEEQKLGKLQYKVNTSALENRIEGRVRKGTTRNQSFTLYRWNTILTRTAYP